MHETIMPICFFVQYTYSFLHECTKRSCKCPYLIYCIERKSRSDMGEIMHFLRESISIFTKIKFIGR